KLVSTYLSSDNSISDKLKQEPNDWPQALLAIGTFGNNRLKEEPQKDDHPQNLHCSDDLTDFTVEEVNKLQQELTKLLIHKSKSRSSTGAGIVEEGRVNPPLNRFRNWPSSLEVDRTASAKFESLEDESNGDLSPNTTIVLPKLKNMLLGDHNVKKKKPISFLLKKIFVRGNDFTPAPRRKNPFHA
ncbi:protein LAZY 4-like, partial [Zingiber officinale]|uniref:protein LAZY 4-like n=1 Tax=Zingiber officinale TaxID=94328 RepID=UPI001C4AF065